MNSISAFRLVSRGAHGLACDDEGVALGPLPLIDRDRGHYRLRPPRDLRRGLRLAYPDASTDWHERRIEGLQRVADALETDNPVRARIVAVQLGFPEFAPAVIANLRKLNPDWTDEPRVPGGQASAGQWTSNGASGRSGGHRTTIITHSDGTIETRRGGTPAWRNNNPGNMKPGPFTYARGAIGDDGKFAIFPDSETGYQAIKDWLSIPEHNQLTIQQAITTWAPKDDANDPEGYTNFVSGQIGLPSTTKLGDMTPEQIEAMANAIRTKEGNKPGTVTITKP